MYEELIESLREKASRLYYDGWTETPDRIMQAANAIEHLELEVAALQTEAGGNVMAEYIEREAIQKRLNRIVEVNNLRTDLAWFTPYGVNALIEEIPAADVRPVVRGKWALFGRRGIYGVMYECSACHAKYDGITNFCPQCGADMREES